MSTPQRKSLELVATKELVLLLMSLAENRSFRDLMTYLETRAKNLAIWGSYLEDDVQSRWADGRVQELAELLRLWEQRDQLDKDFRGEAER